MRSRRDGQGREKRNFHGNTSSERGKGEGRKGDITRRKGRERKEKGYGVNEPGKRGYEKARKKEKEEVTLKEKERENINTCVSRGYEGNDKFDLEMIKDRKVKGIRIK